MVRRIAPRAPPDPTLRNGGGGCSKSSLRAEAAQPRTPPLNTFLPALGTLCFSAGGKALSRSPTSVTFTHALPGTAGEGADNAVPQSGVSRPKVVDMRRNVQESVHFGFCDLWRSRPRRGLRPLHGRYRSSSLVLGRTHATLMKAQRPAALLQPFSSLPAARCRARDTPPPCLGVRSLVQCSHIGMSCLASLMCLPSI